VLGRASIVGAAETSVGKVREHNEDCHFIDPEAGIFIVCDGMGGHAAGEVASALAVKTIRAQWSADATQSVADRWLAKGTPEARKALLGTVTNGVLAAHDAIVAEAAADTGKKGMGTTVVAAIVVGGDVVFAHCGDSRGYLVRDGITVQLTEDHTLLARLLAAGVDVDVDGDGARFKSMLTNALGIGHECKVSCFVVPVADGDRFLLCSDGITEYLQENEIGEVLTTMPSPARSAQRLVEIALARGGGDNATALVVRVLEAGETARPAEQLRREEQAINSCPLWAKLNTQQRIRAQRIALPRDHANGEKVPANTLGDRVAWILVEGEVEQDGFLRGPGSLLYPEALLADRPLPDKEGLAVAQSEVRALALRSDDFKELCDDDPEIGEHLLAAVGTEITRRRPQRRTGKVAVQFDADSRGPTDPGDIATEPRPALTDDPSIATADTGTHATLKDRGDVAHATTLQRPAVDPVGDTAQRAAVNPIGDTAQRPAVDPIGVTLQRPAVNPIGDTMQRPAVEPDAAVATETDEDKPRQPRGSTVPPQTVRKRASTDQGLPVAAADESEEGRRRARGTNPPSEGSRSGLIVPPSETSKAVDEALWNLTEDEEAKPTKTVDDDDAPDDAEISVEVEPETQPAMPSNIGSLSARPTLRAPSPQNLRPPAAPALRPPAAIPPLRPPASIPPLRPPAKPVAEVETAPAHHSEPEIHIEELQGELAADAAPATDTVTLTLDDVDDRASSDPGEGTITIAVDDPSDQISVEPLVAADSAPVRRRPNTDSPE